MAPVNPHWHPAAQNPGRHTKKNLTSRIRCLTLRDNALTGRPVRATPPLPSCRKRMLDQRQHRRPGAHPDSTPTYSAKGALSRQTFDLDPIWHYLPDTPRPHPQTARSPTRRAHAHTLSCRCPDAPCRHSTDCDAGGLPRDLLHPSALFNASKGRQLGRAARPLRDLATPERNAYAEAWRAGGSQRKACGIAWR